MFNNLVNIHDLSTLLKRGPEVFSKLASRLVRGRRGRTKAAWAHTVNPPHNWWDIPAVRARWNRLISGDPQVDYCEYIARKHLAGRNSLRALSLGCGTGYRELRWAELGHFSCIDAYDLSEPRIQKAVDAANKEGYGDIINYRVGDIYKMEMREDYYDVVFGEQSLHHFSPLKEILLRVNGFLRPDGCFVVNEFVGPTRFQWTDRQMEAANNLLSDLPAGYRTLWNSKSIKRKVFRPGRLRMILGDPSEAVESSKIMPLLREIFDVVEVREYGGTVLHLLFSGIAHNFLSDDAETRRRLDICFEAEDSLLRKGEIQSDFIVAVCRKKPHYPHSAG